MLKIINYWGNANQDLTPSGTARKTRRQMVTSARSPHSWVVGTDNDEATEEGGLALAEMVKLRGKTEPAMPLLGINPGEMTYTKNLHTRVHSSMIPTKRANNKSYVL